MIHVVAAKVRSVPWRKHVVLCSVVAVSRWITHPILRTHTPVCVPAAVPATQGLTEADTNGYADPYVVGEIYPRQPDVCMQCVHGSPCLRHPHAVEARCFSRL